MLIKKLTREPQCQYSNAGFECFSVQYIHEHVILFGIKRPISLLTQFVKRPDRRLYAHVCTQRCRSACWCVSAALVHTHTHTQISTELPYVANTCYMSTITTTTVHVTITLHFIALDIKHWPLYIRPVFQQARARSPGYPREIAIILSTEKRYII